jgi:hypothetical protein
LALVDGDDGKQKTLVKLFVFDRKKPIISFSVLIMNVNLVKTPQWQLF